MDRFLSVVTVPFACWLYEALGDGVLGEFASSLPTERHASGRAFPILPGLTALVTSAAGSLAHGNGWGVLSVLLVLLFLGSTWSLAGNPFVPLTPAIVPLLVSFAFIGVLAYKAARWLSYSWPWQGASYGVGTPETAVLLQAVAVAVPVASAAAWAPFNRNPKQAAQEYASLSLGEQASIVTAVLAGGTALAALALVPAVKKRVAEEPTLTRARTWFDLYKKALPFVLVLQLLAAEYGAFWLILRSEPLSWVVTRLVLSSRETIWSFVWMLAVTAATIGCMALLRSIKDGTDGKGEGGEGPTAQLVPTSSNGRRKRSRSPATKRKSSPQPTKAARVSNGTAASQAGPASSSRISVMWLSLPLARRNLIVRKAFHVAALMLFAPPLLMCYGRDDVLALMKVASAGALHVFVFIELLRAALPSASTFTDRTRSSQRLVEADQLLDSLIVGFKGAVDGGMKSFIDERDGGAFILTHLYLIAGCGLPIWLTSGAAGTKTLGVLSALLPLAGILACMGDAAAAVGGVLCSSLGIATPWSRVLSFLPAFRNAASGGSLVDVLRRKTVQGTLGFAAMATSLSVAMLFLAGDPVTTHALATVVAAAVVCAVVETVTVGVDNLLLPVIYLMCLVGGGHVLTCYIG